MAESELAERYTPIGALRLQSRITLSELLNPTKVIPSPGGLPRDWRGLADLCDVPAPGPGTAGEKDPTDTILTAWQRKDATSSSIERLCQFLELLDRYDILDDLNDTINDDVQRYWERLENDNQVLPFVSTTSVDHLILTLDDTQRIRFGLPPQNYHAFVLFADEDKELGISIVETLESDYNLKICYKDRDLIGGLSFEHEAIVRLVSERCNHLVVILSKNFFQSNPVNKFYTSFAQALGIEQRRRKVVPCIYNCDPQLLPPELRYYYMLNCRNENFFTILNRSICDTPTSAQASGGCSIRELPSTASPSLCSSSSKSPSMQVKCKSTVDLEFEKDMDRLHVSKLTDNRWSASEKNLVTSEKLSDCASSNNNISESILSSDRSTKIKETTFFKSFRKYFEYKNINIVQNKLKRKKKQPVTA